MHRYVKNNLPFAIYMEYTWKRLGSMNLRRLDERTARYAPSLIIAKTTPRENYERPQINKRNKNHPI